MDAQEEIVKHDLELKTARDLTNSEILKNEHTYNEIKRLEEIIKNKEEEILLSNRKDDSNKDEEVKLLKEEVNRAKDMFLEYEHTITNITKKKAKS